MIPVNRPLISQSDIDAVTVDLKATFISGESPPVARMEDELAKVVGVKHAVALSSGTSAIDMLISQLKIGKGDTCILPTFTIISTVSQLLRIGAKVKLIDADPLTWSIDSTKAAESIDSSTRLILPVHIYGLPADMDPILEKSNQFGSIVIEDSAEALGVEYKGRPCGGLGHAAVFSFYANKIATGGEGGAITTNDSDLAANLRKYRTLAHENERFVHSGLGWNHRISGLSASLIASQLNRIDLLKVRKVEIGALYNKGLAGHPWIDLAPAETSYGKNLYWVFPILLRRNADYNARTLQLKLKDLGIETRRFFCPMHLQPLSPNYKFAEFLNADFPIANNLWENGLYLPSGLGNTDAEISTVIEKLWSLVP